MVDICMILERRGKSKLARRITGKPGVDTAALDKIVMDAVYDTRWKTMYHAGERAMMTNNIEALVSYAAELLK